MINERAYFLELVQQGEDAASRAYLHWGSVMAGASNYSQLEEEAGQRQDAAENAGMACRAIKSQRSIVIEKYNWRYDP